MTGTTSRLADRTLFRAVLLVLLTVVVHVRLWEVPFQFDDWHQIRDNPALGESADLLRLFTDPYVGSGSEPAFSYRPLLFATFVVDHAIGDGAAWPYRGSSLLVFLVYLLLAVHVMGLLIGKALPDVSEVRIGRAAWLGGALLAVHPLSAEGLLLATSRSSVLLAVLVLASLHFLIRSVERGAGVGWRALVFLMLAMLTKETAVVLAVLAPLVFLAFGSREVWWRRILRAWPIWLTVLVYVGLYLTARALIDAPQLEEGVAGGRPSGSPVPWMVRPARAFLVALRLAGLVGWPSGLSITHEVGIPAGAEALLLTLGWPAVAVFVALAWRVGRAWRIAALGAGVFFASMLPFVVASFSTPMAHHRLVLALLGPASIASLAIVLSTRGRAAGLLAAVLVVGLAVATARYEQRWTSQVALWEYETDLQPDNIRAWNFMVLAYETAGDLERARRAADRQLELAPNVPVFLWKSARLELDAGNLAGTAERTMRGLALAPDFVPLLLVEVERLAQSGDARRALAPAERAVEIDDDCSHCWNALGNVYLLLHDQRAVHAYSRAIALDPSNAEARQNLQRARASMGP